MRHLFNFSTFQKLILLSTSLIFILSGCGGGSSPASGPTNTLTLKQNVRVFSKSSTTTVTPIDDSHVTLSAGAPTLAPGDVIVSEQGNGLLVKVVGIKNNPDGTTSAQTTQATLEDAIQDADIHMEVPLKKSDIRRISPARGVKVTWVSSKANGRDIVGDDIKFDLPDIPLIDLDENPSTTADSLLLNTSITFKPVIYLDINASGGHLHKFECGLKPQVNSDFTISLGGEQPLSVNDKKKADDKSIAFERDLVDINYTTDIQIGFLPVIITNDVKYIVGASAKYDWNMKPHLKVDMNLTAGVGWNDSTGGYAVHSGTVDPHYELGWSEIGGSVKPYTGIRDELKLYGVVGPYVQVDAYVNADVTGILAPPSLSSDLSAGIELLGGIKGQILSMQLFDWQIPAVADYKFWTYHWDWQCPSGTAVTVRDAGNKYIPAPAIYPTL